MASAPPSFPSTTTPPPARARRWFQGICGCVSSCRKCAARFSYAPCAREGADYKVRANSFKRSFDDRDFRAPDIALPRHPLVAAFDRRPGRADGAGRWRHAAHRIRAFNCRVEAAHRHAAAAQSGAMEGGVRSLQDHPAISRTQRGHGSCRVQDHLLVGMEPPATRAHDRGRLSAAVCLVPVARRFKRGSEATLVADLRARCAAGRGRLVDGGVRTLAAGGSFAIPARHPADAGASHFLCPGRCGDWQTGLHRVHPRGSRSPVWRCWC